LPEGRQSVTLLVEALEFVEECDVLLICAMLRGRGYAKGLHVAILSKLPGDTSVIVTF
jgi:hypothetical protein